MTAATTPAADPDVAETVAAAFERDDPELTPAEKETTFRFARDQDRVRFHTDEHGIGRRLAAHPHSRIETAVIRNGPRRVRVGPESVDRDDSVVAVAGTIPVGALVIRGSPRRSTQHAEIVTDRVLGEGQS